MISKEREKALREQAKLTADKYIRKPKPTIEERRRAVLDRIEVSVRIVPPCEHRDGHHN